MRLTVSAGGARFEEELSEPCARLKPNNPEVRLHADFAGRACGIPPDELRLARELY
jgi:hypothetical protein